jgi:phosphatidylserine synthase
MKSPVTENEKRIATDRKRTNLLRVPEQAAIAFFARIMPPFVTPNMLTFVGFVASAIICYGFWLGKSDPKLLSVSIAGFALHWFGDSLDGRIAYYRNIPRKWYGFSLDMCMDWISTVLISFGLYLYLPDNYKVVAFFFATAYAWSMILTLLKYKITDKYSIDQGGLLSPTELRVAICMVLALAMFYPFIMPYFATGIMAIITVINLVDFNRILNYGNERDEAERKVV